MDTTPDRTGDYEPPEVEDIDPAEDREFAVVPGEPGSPGTIRN